MTAPTWFPRALLLVGVAVLLGCYWRLGARHPLAHVAEIALIAALLAAFTWHGHQLQHWRSLWRCAAIGIATAWLCWTLGIDELVAALLPAACQALLAWLVWRTLQPGRTPAIQAIAETMLNEPLVPIMVSYARSSTWRWVIAFVLLAIINAWVTVNYQFSAQHALSLNALDMSVAGLLIVSEFLYRRWRYPEHNTLSFTQFCLGLRRVNPLRILLP